MEVISLKHWSWHCSWDKIWYLMEGIYRKTYHIKAYHFYKLNKSLIKKPWTELGAWAEIWGGGGGGGGMRGCIPTPMIWKVGDISNPPPPPTILESERLVIYEDTPTPCLEKIDPKMLTKGKKSKFGIRFGARIEQIYY